MAIYGVGYNSKGTYPTASKYKKVKCYKMWESMLQRCYDTKSKSYPNYGGAGITVHPDWHDYQNFAAWANQAGFFGGAELDKDFLHIVGPKVYSRFTCKFVTKKLNVSHARAKTFTMLSPKGEEVTFHNLSDFCKEQGLTRKCMTEVLAGRNKQHKGWTTSEEV